jgi:hypothetical protein
MAPTTASKGKLQEVNKAVTNFFGSAFLRLPTPADLKSISDLHHLRVHRVPGMLGSLDCMHTNWKNCPVAWRGSFQGKDKGLSTSLRLLWITVCGSGMPHMATLALNEAEECVRLQKALISYMGSWKSQK